MPVTGPLRYDAEAARLLEATYTSADVVAQRQMVRQALTLRRGEHILDIGTGPGLLAAELAVAAGPDGLVCGIDLSASMLALAATRAATRPPGSAPITLGHADAAQLPYAAASFDAAVSTQVLEYIADVPGVLAEIWRVLRPGGRVLLVDTDWDSLVWRSSDDQRMERVLAAWQQHLVDPHLPRRLHSLLARAGFQLAPPRIVPLFNVGFDPASYSAGLVTTVARFVVDRHGVTAEEVQAWASDLRSLGADYFFSLNRYLFTATKPV